MPRKSTLQEQQRKHTITLKAVNDKYKELKQVNGVAVPGPAGNRLWATIRVVQRLCHRVQNCCFRDQLYMKCFFPLGGIPSNSEESLFSFRINWGPQLTD